MPLESRIEQWFLQYSHDIYNYLIYFTGKRDVEDLAQEVFFRALKNVHQFKSDAKPRTWLISIARNLVIDQERRNKIARLLPERFKQTITSSIRTPEQELELKEDRYELYQKLRMLKPTYREVLVLRGIQELTVEETAEILGWSTNRVNVTLHRALKALQKQYLDHGKEGIIGELTD